MFSDRKAPKSDRKATKSGRKIRFSFFMNFFEFLNFETEKFEISPEFVSRTQPVTVNFPVNRIYRPKFFSLAVTRAARWWPDDERGDAVRGEAVAVDMDMDTHGDADRSIGLPGQLALLVTISADC